MMELKLHFFAPIDLTTPFIQCLHQHLAIFLNFHLIFYWWQYSICISVCNTNIRFQMSSHVRDQAALPLRYVLSVCLKMSKDNIVAAYAHLTFGKLIDFLTPHSHMD